MTCLPLRPTTKQESPHLQLEQWKLLPSHLAPDWWLSQILWWCHAASNAEALPWPWFYYNGVVSASYTLDRWSNFLVRQITSLFHTLLVLAYYTDVSVSSEHFYRLFHLVCYLVYFWQLQCWVSDWLCHTHLLLGVPVQQSLLSGQQRIVLFFHLYDSVWNKMLISFWQ